MKPIEFDAPAPISVTNQAPSIASANGHFYVLYGLGNGTTNRLCATIFDNSDKTWRTASMNYGSTYPKYMENGKIRTVTVNTVICVAYQVSATEVALCTITDPMTGSFSAKYTASANLGDFCLYTDGTYAYLITNEGGTIKSQRLNGKTLDSLMTLNGTGGAAQGAPMATATSSVTAISSPSTHIVYTAADGQVDVYQGSGSQWACDYIVQGAGSYKSYELFNSGDSLLLCNVTSMGAIDVFEFQDEANPPSWKTLYMSANSVPAAQSGAQVGVNFFGIFISYADTNGKLQCVYRLNGGSWSNIQIGGAGAPEGFPSDAPVVKSAVGVGVYQNLAYHACYVSTDNRVYDVFWGGNWHGVEMYPKVPAHVGDAMTTDHSGKSMMP